MNPPLGLPILAAVLEGAGHTATVTDLEALRVIPDALGAAYAGRRDKWPDAVGFTVTTHNQRGARECIAALRGAGYDGYIALGGPHITLLGRDAIDTQESWGADAWIMGECEGNVTQVFAERRTGLIEGAPLPIEAVPAPLWDKHRPAPREYGGNMPRLEFPEGISMWSRGCPHRCIFCGNPVFARQRVRRRPPGRIAEEMADLKARGVRSVFVYDDELPGMPGGDGWLTDVCAAVAPLGMTWKCQGRCSGKTDPTLLEAMYAAGCRVVMWGVESFSDKVLADMQKDTTEADVWHTLRAARKAGIANWLFLMVGNYGETARDLAYTEARLSAANAEGLVQWRQVTVCTPMPGTELYRRAQEEGWLVESPEVGPQMNQVYAPTPWLAARELRHWKARLGAA